jgi:hypothetical protein
MNPTTIDAKLENRHFEATYQCQGMIFAANNEHKSYSGLFYLFTSSTIVAICFKRLDILLSEKY